jgi:hypothetical protein
VTPEHLEWFLNNPDIMRRYPYISDNKITNKGIIVFSKYPCWFYERHTASERACHVLFVEPVNGINGVPLIFATGQFSHDCCDSELYDVFNIINEHASDDAAAIVCGDF